MSPMPRKSQPPHAMLPAGCKEDGAVSEAGMFDRILRVLDWFIPDAIRRERSEHGLARNFVFTHLFGPALAQSISIFLYLTDPRPGIECWAIILTICSFWVLPFALRITRNLQLVALLSIQLLAFASLYGSFHYGGVSSPFMPWLIVSLLLGFFYFSGRLILPLGLFSINLLAFCGAAYLFGFPERLSSADLATVGWISILSATVYMSWMAIYYGSVISMRSDLERELERHRATSDRLRQAKDAAERASHARSIFLAKMSHELRTPLNAVIGYSEILLEEAEDLGGAPEKVADLQRIRAAGKHLLSLVTDVLDLSKIEADTIEFLVETACLQEVVSDVIATSRSLVLENGNQLVEKIPSHVGSVTTDITKLRQVLLNLLSNAAKFTSNGIITVSVKRDPSPAGDWVEIAVQDTGIGIAQDELGRLFQNFAQASALTSSRYGGTGLGLALSQKLAALMGGGIAVVSERGRGSRFTLRIPASIRAAEEEAEPASGNRLAEASRPFDLAA
jgi:signal transduction histidine kinase